MGSIWNNDGVSWTRETIIDDPQNAHSGEGYFQAIVSADPPNHWDNQGVFEEITVDDSTSYRFQIWMKATDGDVTTVNITSGVYETWSELNTKYGVVLTPEWVKHVLMVYISDTASLPKNNGLHQIRFPIHYNKVGTFCADDVSIYNSTIAGAGVHNSLLTIDFGYALEWASDVDKAAFTVKVDDIPVEISTAEMRDLGDVVEPLIDLTLAQPVSDVATVTVSHDGNSGLIYSTYSPITEGFKAAAFTDEEVEHVTGITSVGKKYDNKVSFVVRYETLSITGDIEAKTVSIYNISGQMIKSFTSGFDAINISDLPYGMYIVKVEAGKNIFTGKFIK